MGISRPETALPEPPHRGRRWSRSPRSYPVVEEVSAGGVCLRVQNGVPYLAAIARRNRAGHIEWCLPKGHIEPGESLTETAEREVAEEAGVSGRVIQHLCSIDYWFSSTRTRVHKTVHHYLLEYVSGEVTAERDPDREAEDAAWIPLLKARDILAYPNEQRVTDAAIALLYPEA